MFYVIDGKIWKMCVCVCMCLCVSVFVYVCESERERFAITERLVKKKSTDILQK